VRTAVIDDRLHVRVRGMRELVYTTPCAPDDDRPPHVRAASAIAVRGDDVFVIQDDASFIARVRGDEVTAITLPHDANGRRRFEVGLGNKLDKLDLESAVVIGDELWAFGSGSLPVRERICRLRGDAVTLSDARALYAGVRAAVGSPLNLEGAAVVGDELWLCHRGNTGPDDLGPAIARLPLAGVRACLDGGAVPAITIDRYDLGEVASIKIGFTDACALGDRVFFLAAAEASADAIADGEVLAAMLGVIGPDGVRVAPLALDHLPLKAEGLAVTSPDRALIVVDPDDPDAPTRLYEVALEGPWT